MALSGITMCIKYCYLIPLLCRLKCIVNHIVNFTTFEMFNNYVPMVGYMK